MQQLSGGDVRENRAVMVAFGVVLAAALAGGLTGFGAYVLAGFVLGGMLTGLAYLWPWKVDID